MRKLRVDARIDVGGKLFTNHLKELVSFRQWNMMEETYIMNDVKEKCCYVSTQFAADLEACRFVCPIRSSRVCSTYPIPTFRIDKSRNSIVQEYVLPDFSRNRHGYIRQRDNHPIEGEQILYMGNERFSIPEVLFCPEHIGTSTLREALCLLEMTSYTLRVTPGWIGRGHCPVHQFTP